MKSRYNEPKKHIITQQPMSPLKINEICQQIATARSSKIDGTVLSNLLRFCYKYALKRNELVDLRIADVQVSKDADSSKLNVRGSRPRELSIADEGIDMIAEHLNHLKRKRYKTNKNAPLFPARTNEKYEADKLKNHLSKFFKDMGGEASLEKIRQSGACSFYDTLRGDRVSPKDCLERTAKFLGVDEKQAHGILSGCIQPTGTKKEPADKHLEEIAQFNNLIRQHFCTVRESIDRDPDLNERERSMLKGELSQVVGASTSSPATTTPEAADPPSLLDMVKAVD
jgi:hypothetical protein